MINWEPSLTDVTSVLTGWCRSEKEAGQELAKISRSRRESGRLLLEKCTCFGKWSYRYSVIKGQ